MGTGTGPRALSGQANLEATDDEQILVAPPSSFEVFQNDFYFARRGKRRNCGSADPIRCAQFCALPECKSVSFCTAPEFGSECEKPLGHRDLSATE
jgi:hypothetical protein